MKCVLEACSPPDLSSSPIRILQSDTVLKPEPSPSAPSHKDPDPTHAEAPCTMLPDFLTPTNSCSKSGKFGANTGSESGKSGSCGVEPETGNSVIVRREPGNVEILPAPDSGPAEPGSADAGTAGAAETPKCDPEHQEQSCDSGNKSTMQRKLTTKKSEDYDSGISSPSSSSPPAADSIDIKIAAKKRRRKRRRGTTLAGASFEDCYERTGKILGSGAFSQVELCKCVRTGHEFAVKIIKKDSWYNGYTRARVHAEVEILYRCTGHPNIVQLQDFYEGKDEFYLVFEMMRGGALIDHIERRKTFDERAACTIAYCITSALDHLHSAGIAHRDLKFDNLLCNDPEDFTQVKICDFDLGGQKLDFPYLSTPLMDSPVGSAEFMAPEVVDLFVGHKSTYDKRCDMWSLGITLYIMLFGRPPFTGRCGLQCGWDDGRSCAMCQEHLFKSITSGRITFPPDSKVSEPARDLIKKLLVKDARKRYTASDVLVHPWITSRGSDNVLETPDQLRRNTLSATNLSNFANRANEHYRVLNSGLNLNSLAEALDNLNLSQNDENESVEEKKSEETTPELTPTTEKAPFFMISDEDDWYTIT